MSVQQKVTNIIIEQFRVAGSLVTPEARFQEDLGATSLDEVQMIMALERDFGIQIPDDEARKIGSVQEAIDYIKNNTRATSSS